MRVRSLVVNLFVLVQAARRRDETVGEQRVLDFGSKFSNGAKYVSQVDLCLPVLVFFSVIVPIPLFDHTPFAPPCTHCTEI